jgi:uncharacterized protein YecT (DUF1311 family)
MIRNHEILAVLFTFVLVILAACGNSSDESSVISESERPNDHTSYSETVENNKEDTSVSNTIETSLESKKAYREKLEVTKIEVEAMETTDSSTYALKKVENDRWDIWDELLNEIYEVLKEQLLPEEMDQLIEEQRNWIKYRDDSALEASLKYKGGTQEHLEYVAVLANLTEERCYELVANHMK